MAKRSKERTQFLADVIITAVEGGVNYWAAVSGYQWSNEAPETTQVYIHEWDDDEGDYKPEGVLVTVETIAKAFSLIRSDAEIKYVGEKYRTFLRNLYSDMGEGEDWDAGDADNIIQIALFGEVVYG